MCVMCSVVCVYCVVRATFHVCALNVCAVRVLLFRFLLCIVCCGICLFYLRLFVVAPGPLALKPQRLH